MIALLFAIAICIATPTTENKGLKESNRALQQALEALMKYEEPNAFLDSIRDSVTNVASESIQFTIYYYDNENCEGEAINEELGQPKPYTGTVYLGDRCLSHENPLLPYYSAYCVEPGVLDGSFWEDSDCRKPLSPLSGVQWNFGECHPSLHRGNYYIATWTGVCTPPEEKMCFSESMLHVLIQDLLFDDTTSESKEVAVGKVYTGAQAKIDGKNYIKQAFKNCRNIQCVFQLIYATMDFKDCFTKAVGCWDYCNSYTQSMLFGGQNTKNEKIARANQHIYCKPYQGNEHWAGDGSPVYIVAPIWLENKEWPTF